MPALNVAYDHRFLSPRKSVFTVGKRSNVNVPGEPMEIPKLYMSTKCVVVPEPLDKVADVSPGSAEISTSESKNETPAPVSVKRLNQAGKFVFNLSTPIKFAAQTLPSTVPSSVSKISFKKLDSSGDQFV